MYNYSDITSIHFEITSKCQARCPMCPRRIQGGKLNPNISLCEISLNEFKTYFPIEFIQQLYSFNFCGNLGDPIIAKDTLKICEYLRTHNNHLHITLHTNGSAKTKSFWSKLGQLKVEVTFGIDGLNDTHSLYRVNTNYETIIKNAKTFIANNGSAHWHMLVFKHNEHQVEDCRQLAFELGFKSFQTKYTSRFREESLEVYKTDTKVSHIIYPTTRSIEISKNHKKHIEIVPNKINCKVQNNKQIYVGADGTVTPCCWLDLTFYPDSSFSKNDYLNKIKYFPNLKNNTLKEIFDSNYFNEIEKTWINNPVYECNKQCGNFDKFAEQFK